MFLFQLYKHIEGLQQPPLAEMTCPPCFRHQPGSFLSRVAIAVMTEIIASSVCFIKTYVFFTVAC